MSAPAVAEELASHLQAIQAGTAVTRASPDLRRGINFGDAMDAPNEGDWGWTLTAADFRNVREQGFDHVRVPMRISAHADTQAPYAIADAFLKRMDWAVDQALSNDLGIVIDMHHYEEIMREPRAHGDRLVALWRQIAQRYRGLPPAVVYELLNEPTGRLKARNWNSLVVRVIEEIRAVDSTRLLIVEGARWASARDLRDTLKVPPGDRNLIGSFHLYDPVYFTHQGAGWMAAKYSTRGVVFPGPPQTPLVVLAATAKASDSRRFFKRYNSEAPATNPSGPAIIKVRMDMAKAFAARTGLRIYVGEFGSIVNADLASRARWTRLVREEAEKRGFGWAYWDYCRNFAAYTPCGAGGRWIKELKDALLN